jgi:Zn-dependent M16 (insulinase) family peptidase
MPEIVLKPGEELEGFVVRAAAPLPGLQAVAYEIEHAGTGARLLHVHSADAENLFAIAFKTPPADDTGVPHILEHSVLAGSAKFPVKDPFVEMLKMSMATFINAMTYGDKTVYPVSSNVRQDFYNLAEVYCDAVFHPTLAPETFKQEGHHLEFLRKGDRASELIVKGIVYNEMKGAYSSAEGLLARYCEQGLFPDTLYGKDSGGDPHCIPDLSYPDFKRFHRALYHPSNAYIFIYGDIPTREHLAFLRDKLGAFKRRKIKAEIQRQPRWSEPRCRCEAYPIGRNEPTGEKAYLTLHWLVGDGADALDVMGWSILDYILLGNEAAPLKKALIDSKLGADLSFSGFNSGQLETTFHLGLKGGEAGRQEAFLKLVLETLQKIADGGITPEMVAAAFQQAAYHNLEIQPLYPLRLMMRSYATWLYGADPLSLLRAGELLAELRRRYEAEPALFGRLIRERLLDNPHRLLLVLAPDRELQAKQEAEFAGRMEKQKSRLDHRALAKIVKEQEKLEELQSRPNSPEALATLPQLKVQDLPPRPKHIPTTVEKLDGKVDLLRNDVFANGVNYLELDINLEGLPDELYAYLPLYGDCIRKMGAAGLNYLQVAERVAANTGGIGFGSAIGTHAAEPRRCLRRARFTLKTLDEKIAPALDILRDLFFEPDFRDTARLKDVLLQAKAWHRSSLVERGVELATLHASRGLSAEAALAEALGGAPQMRLIGKLAGQYGLLQPDLAAKLEAIRAFIRNRKRLTASFTGSNSAYEEVRRRLGAWVKELNADAIQDQPSSFKPLEAPLREGLAAPANVAFCTQVLPAPHRSHPDAPLLQVAGRMLSLGYIWDEVRIKGGAYGGGCGYDGSRRAWYFFSYRDPWINRTLQIFDGLTTHVRQAEWTQAEIDRAIIGTAKNGERPIRPSEATGQALWRHVAGETIEFRERQHTAILCATPREIKRAMLEQLEANSSGSSVCVFASREKLENANKENAEAPLAVQDLTLEQS